MKTPSRRDPTESPMSTEVCSTYCKGRDLKHVQNHLCLLRYAGTTAS